MPCKRINFYFFALLLAILALSNFSCNLEKIDAAPVVSPFKVAFSLVSGKKVVVQSVVEAVGKDGYVVSGWLIDTNTFATNLFVLKTNENGTLEMPIVTNLGFIGNTYGGNLIRTDDSSYILVGTQDFGSDANAVVIKLNKDLGKVWTKSFGESNYQEHGQDVAETTDGRLILASSVNDGTNPDDVWLVKIRNDNGTMVDTQRVLIPGFGRYWPASIARNGSVFGILCYNIGISIPSPYFLKVDANLNTLIMQPLNNGGGNIDGEIMPDGADGFVVAHGIIAQLIRQAFLVGVSGNGDETSPLYLWDSFTDTGCDGCSKTVGGQYLPAGWAAQTTGSKLIAVGARVNANLSIDKIYTYPDQSFNTQFKASAPVSDGGTIFAGMQNDTKLLLVKLNAEFKDE